MSRVLVCYLVAPGEEYALKAHWFATSYMRHPAGADHDFMVVNKGDVKFGAFPLVDSRFPSKLIAANHANDDGWDISSLQRVCREHGSGYDWVMWFGSNSRILADGWLHKLLLATRLGDVGAVGPTGSFEAGVSGQHPNPHLRTSTIMVSPFVLNSLDFLTAGSRRDAYEFEHGNDSLYRRLERRGLCGWVVGRDGKAYGEEGWATSRTYRREYQQNLLVADKQTDAYMAADPAERLALARMAGWDPS